MPFSASKFSQWQRIQRVMRIPFLQINKYLKILNLSFFCVYFFLGFMASIQRNPQISQYASQQSGPSMSPHPSPGGQMHSGIGSFPQSNSSGTYGTQISQYGSQGKIINTLVALF